MRKQITQLDTFIKNRELHVKIYIENEWFPILEIPFSYLVASVGDISFLQIDLLKNCELEIMSYYKFGELMHNGYTATNENEYPKKWKINFDGTLNDLRKRNEHFLPNFQIIKTISVKEDIKGPYVLVFTNQNNVYPYKLHLFESLVHLNQDEFHLLTGTFISPIWHKMGDTSVYNGRFTKITQDNTVIETFNIRIEGIIDSHYLLYGTSSTKKATKSDMPNNDLNDSNHYECNRSYEKYNGYNDFDDDTIDDAFEGDPEATWNVD